MTAAAHTSAGEPRVCPIEDAADAVLLELVAETPWGGTMYAQSFPAGTVVRPCWLTSERAFVERRQDDGRFELPVPISREAVVRVLVERERRDVVDGGVTDPLASTRRDHGDLFRGGRR